MSDAVVQTGWNTHHAWSLTADRLKRRVMAARGAALALSILGAATATLAATVAEVQAVAGLVSAVALALVPFLVGHFLSPEATRNWLRARSVSEGIKSEVWRFRAGTLPYTGSGSGSGSALALQARIAEIGGWGSDLAGELAHAGQPTATAPGPLDQAAYIRDRVREQIDRYYRPKAAFNAGMASRCRWVEIVVAAIAAVLGAVAAYWGLQGSAPLAAWVAVLTTVAGSVAAHAATSNYAFQATTYFATARQLEDLADEWETAGKPLPAAEWSALVDRCELAISAENRGWMAKLDSR